VDCGNCFEGLDAGGVVSYLSTDFAHSVGCKPWGQITGFTLTGQRLDMPRCDGFSFDLQGRSFAGPIFGVFDIMKFMPPNVPRIDGSIGLDVFSEHDGSLPDNLGDCGEGMLVPDL